MTARDKLGVAMLYRREWCAWLAIPRQYRNLANTETYRTWYKSARAAWYRAHRWQRDNATEASR